jgi:predicted nuclease with TOPRIM domain
MDALNKYLEIKKKVEIAQQKADKAEGALEQTMLQLKKEFGCTSLKDAKEKLAELEKEKSKLEKQFAKAVEEFETEFSDKLNEEDE